MKLSSSSPRTALRWFGGCFAILGFLAVPAVHAQAALPSLSVTDVKVTEGNGGAITTASFVISLSAASSVPVTFKCATANGTASSATDYTAVPLTSVTIAAGKTSKAFVVGVKGDLIDEADETFSLKLSSPAGATLADATGVATIVDNDTSVVSAAGASVAEGNSATTTLGFTLTLSRANSRTVTVNAKTSTAATSPATAGTDYVALGTTMVTFAAGQTSKTIPVSVKGDKFDEDNENIGLTLATPVNATLGAVVPGIIKDDDATPTLKVSDAKVSEGDSGALNATFTITLSAPSNKTVSVKYATNNVTAVASLDYTALPLASLTFAPGQTSKTVNVVVKGDLLDEADETFLLKLSAPVSATLSDYIGVGTILDNDAPPQLAMKYANGSVKEGNIDTAGAMVIVTLSVPSGRTVTVQYATQDAPQNWDGLDLADTQDYVAATSTLTFSPGQTSRAVVITNKGDLVPEDDEKFLVVLSSPEGATLDSSKASMQIVIKNDDNHPPTAYYFSEWAPESIYWNYYFEGEILHVTFDASNFGFDEDGDPLTLTSSSVDGQSIRLVNNQLILNWKVHGNTQNPGTAGYTTYRDVIFDFTLSDGKSSVTGRYYGYYFVFTPYPDGGGEEWGTTNQPSFSSLAPRKSATIPSANRF